VGVRVSADADAWTAYHLPNDAPLPLRDLVSDIRRLTARCHGLQSSQLQLMNHGDRLAADLRDFVFSHDPAESHALEIEQRVIARQLTALEHDLQQLVRAQDALLARLSQRLDDCPSKVQMVGDSLQIVVLRDFQPVGRNR
jgi:hypothetical protein